MPDSNIYDYNKPDEILNQIRGGTTYTPSLMNAVRGIASIPGAMYKNIDLGIGKTLSAVARSAGGQIANSYADNPKPMDTTPITDVINRPADTTMPKIALGVGSAAPQPKILTLEEAKAAGARNSMGITPTAPAAPVAPTPAAPAPAAKAAPALPEPPALPSDDPSTVYSYTDSKGQQGIGNILPPGSKLTGTVLRGHTYSDTAPAVGAGVGAADAPLEKLTQDLNAEIARIKALPPKVTYDRRGVSHVEEFPADRQAAIEKLLGHLTTLGATTATAAESAKVRAQAEKDLNAYRQGELGVSRQNAETNAKNAETNATGARTRAEEIKTIKMEQLGQKDRQLLDARLKVLGTTPMGYSDSLAAFRLGRSKERVPEEYQPVVNQAMQSFETAYQEQLTKLGLPDTPARRKASEEGWEKSLTPNPLANLLTK